MSLPCDQLDAPPVPKPVSPAITLTPPTMRSTKARRGVNSGARSCRACREAAGSMRIPLPSIGNRRRGTDHRRRRSQCRPDAPPRGEPAYEKERRNMGEPNRRATNGPEGEEPHAVDRDMHEAPMQEDVGDEGNGPLENGAGLTPCTARKFCDSARARSHRRGTALRTGGKKRVRATHAQPMSAAISQMTTAGARRKGWRGRPSTRKATV